MIVITGASGFVGEQLAPLLSREAPTLLVSRNPASLRSRMPGSDICSYDDLATRNLTGATFVHLAVRNNNRPDTAEEYHAINVNHLMQVAAIAKGAGAVKFINFCSTHALTAGSGDPYGQSKREGASKLAAYWPDGVINLYLPAIYGKTFQGRLARLNALPMSTRPVVISMLRLLKPLISIENVHRAVVDLTSRPIRGDDPWRTEHYAADLVSDHGMYAAITRILDLTAALLVLILAGWLMLFIALYIRLDSRGPAIFAQQRVGRFGRVFTCYKFRTMAVGTTQLATHQVTASSVTRAGGFLRRTKLDELPQVVNILRNQMSLVGPRPCLPVQEELIDRRAARGVLSLKPGITGLAQINDIDMSIPATLAAWDDRSGAFRTLVSYTAILLRTVTGGGHGDRIAASH